MPLPPNITGTKNIAHHEPMTLRPRPKKAQFTLRVSPYQNRSPKMMPLPIPSSLLLPFKTPIPLLPFRPMHLLLPIIIPLPLPLTTTPTMDINTPRLVLVSQHLPLLSLQMLVNLLFLTTLTLLSNVGLTTTQSLRLPLVFDGWTA